MSTGPFSGSSGSPRRRSHSPPSNRRWWILRKFSRAASKGFQEEPGGGLVDLADGRAQVVARPLEVIALAGQEGQALVLLGVLLDREHVDGAEAFDSLHERGQLLLQVGGISFHRLGHLDQLLERPAPTPPPRARG